MGVNVLTSIGATAVALSNTAIVGVAEAEATKIPVSVPELLFRVEVAVIFAALSPAVTEN